jgi:hypothetical protein
VKKIEWRKLAAVPKFHSCIVYENKKVKEYDVAVWIVSDIIIIIKIKKKIINCSDFKRVGQCQQMTVFYELIYYHQDNIPSLLGTPQIKFMVIIFQAPSRIEIGASNPEVSTFSPLFI